MISKSDRNVGGNSIERCYGFLSARKITNPLFANLRMPGTGRAQTWAQLSFCRAARWRKFSKNSETPPRIYPKNINPPYPPWAIKGDLNKVGGDHPRCFRLLLVILSPLPPFQEGGNRQHLGKGMVGDRGFEPLTSTVCRKLRSRRKRRK
jgi:hypothetical protein